MDNLKLTNERNRQLLNGIVEKAKTKYNGEIDFIGVFGSSARGEDDQYSNLDLVIVTSLNSQLKIDYRFVLDDGAEIGYYFKSKTWEEYENMIGTVWAREILQVKPIYFADVDAQERFLRIKRICEEYVLAPLNVEKMKKISPLIVNLKVANSDVQTANKEMVKFNAIKLLMASVEMLTLLNSSYYRFSVPNRVKDIEMLAIVPKGYKTYYKTILEKTDEKELKQVANQITIETVKVFDKLYEIFSIKEYSEKHDFYEEFIKSTNSNYVRCQVYSNKALSSLVSYDVLSCVMNIKQNYGKKIKVPASDIFKNLPFAMREIKNELLEMAVDKGGLNIFTTIDKAIDKF